MPLFTNFSFPEFPSWEIWLRTKDEPGAGTDGDTMIRVLWDDGSDFPAFPGVKNLDKSGDDAEQGDLDRYVVLGSEFRSHGGARTIWFYFDPKGDPINNWACKYIFVGSKFNNDGKFIGTAFNVNMTFTQKGWYRFSLQNNADLVGEIADIADPSPNNPPSENTPRLSLNLAQSSVRLVENGLVE